MIYGNVINPVVNNHKLSYKFSSNFSEIRYKKRIYTDAFIITILLKINNFLFYFIVFIATCSLLTFLSKKITQRRIFKNYQ